MSRSVHDQTADPAEAQTAPGYPSKVTAEVVGITYRQLDYWAREGLLVPSITNASGSGSRRAYSYRNLLELKIIKRMLDAGITLQRIRSLFEYMRRELNEDISRANLIIDGSTVICARSDAELIDVMQRGQGVLNVLPLSSVKQELDAAIIELRVGDSAGDAADQDIEETASEPWAPRLDMAIGEA